MKKILYIFSLSLIVFACKQETKVDYTILSGKITNYASGMLTLNDMNDRNNIDTLNVSNEGVFLDTITLNDGNFVLFDGKNVVKLYLMKGNDIKINFDAADSQNSLTITGTGAAHSNYLIEKDKKTAGIMGQGTAIFQLEEAEYKTKIEEIKAAGEKMLKIDGVSGAFKKQELKNLNYEYLNSLNSYEPYHAHYAKKPDFKASKDFFAGLKDLDLNNEEDYNFSMAYKQLVGTTVSKKAQEISEKDGLGFSVAFLKAANIIDSEKIKNDLIYSIAGSLERVQNLDEFYTAFNEMSTNEDHKAAIKKSYDVLRAVHKGQPSPKFANYENHAGGTTSLDDLKGKYVYIDVWATWCGPCIAEIPSLKKVEKAYHGKNIEFVSLSIDTEADYNKWKAMVTDKDLGGIQILADKAWQSQFIQDYLITGIPRFILIDPAGIIVNANAPRPSDANLIALFDELKI